RHEPGAVRRAGRSCRQGGGEDWQASRSPGPLAAVLSLAGQRETTAGSHGAVRGEAAAVREDHPANRRKLQCRKALRRESLVSASDSAMCRKQKQGSRCAFRVQSTGKSTLVSETLLPPTFYSSFLIALHPGRLQITGEERHFAVPQVA